MKTASRQENRATRGSSLATIIGLVVPAIISFLFGGSLINSYNELQANFAKSQKWEHTKGTITRIRWARRNNHPERLDDFAVSYSVNGRSYECTRFNFEPDTSNRTTFAHDHAQGDTVDVFFDPAAPESAVLDIKQEPMQMRYEEGVGFLAFGCGWILLMFIRFLRYITTEFDSMGRPLDAAQAFMKAAIAGSFFTAFLGILTIPLGHFLLAVFHR